MTKYHSDDYIKFLRSIRPDNMSEYSKQMQRCKFSGEGLIDIYCFHQTNRIHNLPFSALQLTWERTVPCLTVCLSSASSPEGAPSVRIICFPLYCYCAIASPGNHIKIWYKQRVDPSLCCSWCGEVEQAADRHRHQLGRRPAPRQEVRGLWVLLRQRHRTRYSGVTEVSAAAPSCTQGSVCLERVVGTRG